MSKFLLFSDIHIFQHKKSEQRLQDCLNCLVWVFETAKKHNIKNILFGGDFFHDRTKIESLVLHETFAVLKKYLDGSINLYLLLGNHDLWYFEKTSISSVTAVSALPNVHIIDQPKQIIIDKISWHFVPFTHNPIKDIEYLSKHNPQDSFLLAHLAVDGAKLNSKGSIADVEIEHDGEMTKVNSNIFSDYRHVFLGHYHNAQMISTNTEYIGSPLQLSFGEFEETKNIVILEFMDDQHIVNYVANNFSPQHFEGSLETLLKIDPTLLNKSFVSVLVNNEEKDEINKNIKLLEEQGVSLIKVKKNACERNQDNELKQVEIAKEILSQSDKMVQKFVEISATELDKDLLISCGLDIINKSQE
jgi:DNA repair exonuclease SbcCD nuclease subunit